jgi:hypothetical protein
MSVAVRCADQAVQLLRRIAAWPISVVIFRREKILPWTHRYLYAKVLCFRLWRWIGTCLFCLRFVSPFPSYLLFTTKEVACRFHTPDGENIVDRPQCCAPLWLHHSCLLCVWERNVWRMCVLFSPCLSVRPSVCHVKQLENPWIDFRENLYLTVLIKVSYIVVSIDGK